MKKWIFPIMLSSSLLCSTSLLAQDYNNETVTPGSNTAMPSSTNDTTPTTTTTGTTTTKTSIDVTTAPSTNTNTMTWKGSFYEITPKRSDITVEYCKSHVPDTYETDASMVDKEIVAANGVKAKDIGYTTKEVGGIFMHTGTAMFSGETDGKPWQEKVWYYSESLEKEMGMEQGVWYTKDCKGFYKAGPASKM